MIDIQERNSTFKWVCISLFILVILFYSHGCDIKMDRVSCVRPVFHAENTSHLLYSYAAGYSRKCQTGVRPVQNLCYLLPYKAVGLQQCHIVLNIFRRVMHLTISILIFLLIKRLTGNTLVGISSAALFAGSPGNIHPITHCTAMDDQMVCFFGLLSILFYIRHFDDKGTYNYLLSLIFLLLAFLSKESGGAIFLIIVLLDIYLRKDSVEEGGPWGNGLSMRGIKSYLPFFLLSITYGLFLFSYCDTTTESSQVMDSIKTLSLLTCIGRFFSTFRDLFECIILTSGVGLSINSLIAPSIVAVYLLSDTRLRRTMQLLILCSLIPALPSVIYSGHYGTIQAYFSSVFFLGLLACVMNQGFERLSGLSVVQSFFVEIPKRRLLATMILCWLVIYFGLVQYTHDAYIIPFHGYTIAILRPLVKHSTIYGPLMLLLALTTILGMTIVCLRSIKDVMGFILPMALCTLFLITPVFASDFSGKLSYSIAALSTALLACAVGYVVDRSLNPRTVDFKNPRAVCFALLLLMHAGIFTSNYGYVQGRLEPNITRQKEHNWLAKPVRDFVLQREGYQGKVVYLLNFAPLHWMWYDEATWKKEVFSGVYNKNSSPSVHQRRVLAYIYGLDDIHAFDDIYIRPDKVLQKKLILDTFVEEFNHPEISAEEFDKLAKNHNNRMLLLDNVTEQILDVSGIVFNRVQDDLIGDKEKQKAFILP